MLHEDSPQNVGLKRDINLTYPALCGSMYKKTARHLIKKTHEFRVMPYPFGSFGSSLIMLLTIFDIFDSQQTYVFKNDPYTIKLMNNVAYLMT